MDNSLKELLAQTQEMGRTRSGGPRFCADRKVEETLNPGFKGLLGMNKKSLRRFSSEAFLFMQEMGLEPMSPPKNTIKKGVFSTLNRLGNILETIKNLLYQLRCSRFIFFKSKQCIHITSKYLTTSI